MFQTKVGVLQYLLFENHAVYEMTWGNIVEWGRPQMTIWHMRIECWISMATNTRTEVK